MALEDSVIFSNQVDNRRHGIIGGDQWEVIGVLTGKVVDLEVIGLGPGHLGLGRVLSGRRPRPFVGRLGGRGAGFHGGNWPGGTRIVLIVSRSKL